MISGDKRYARVIAYESDASDLVAGDTNGQRDVFAVRRRQLRQQRIALGAGPHGADLADGQRPAGQRPVVQRPVDGAFEYAETVAPSCVGFLSAATNIVGGRRPTAWSTPSSPRSTAARPQGISPDGAGETTAVAVSGDCSVIAMVTGGRLYLTSGGRPG